MACVSKVHKRFDQHVLNCKLSTCFPKQIQYHRSVVRLDEAGHHSSSFVFVAEI